MGGARQLLRKLSRASSWQFHLPRTSASFSSGSHEYYQEHHGLPHSQQALYLHSSDSDEEPRQRSSLSEHRHGRHFAGMPMFTPSEDGNCGKCLPRKEVSTFSADSSTSIHRGFSALNTHVRIRGGCIRRPLFVNGYAPMQGVSIVRFSSTSTTERLEDEFGRNPGVGGTAEVLSTTNAGVAATLVTPEAQAISEVSAVIGDCSYPTAFLQLVMEYVHVQGGLPWWAAIVATTIVIRLLCLPVVVYQLRSAVKLSLMRPEMEKINAEIKNSDYDPRIAAEGRERIMALFAKHNTTPFSPFIGAVLQAPVFMCFFFAIRNMTERVESFKDGGFLWFTDLTTTDGTFILPLLLSASMLLTIELNAAEGMEGNPFADKMKNYMRIFAVVLFPISLSFEKALFCYWLASNYFSLAQSTLFKHPVVKEYLKIPSTAHLAAAGEQGVQGQAAQEEQGVLPTLAVMPDESDLGQTRKKITKILGRKKVKGSRRR